jgi:tRNA threonylcarbamoyl adenosine modification protein YeaZ
MELAIDTSTETASIALSREGEVIAELTWYAGQNHTAELVPSIIDLLRRADSGLKDIRGLVVAMGPGSFNGLRVAMSTAKGLGFALGLPLVGISTLEVEAYPYALTRLPVCAMIGAGRGEVAAALFQSRRGRWRRLLDEHITTVDDLLPRIGGRTVFCGRIPAEAESRLRDELGGRALVVSGGAALRRAGYLAQLGWARMKDRGSDPIPTLQPLYLRRPSITVSRKARRVPRRLT